MPDTFEYSLTHFVSKGSTQRWEIQGEIPVPIVMALVVLRYLRKGSQPIPMPRASASSEDTGIHSFFVFLTFLRYKFDEFWEFAFASYKSF
jgi:hypothetical protein